MTGEARFVAIVALALSACSERATDQQTFVRQCIAHGQPVSDCTDAAERLIPEKAPHD